MTLSYMCFCLFVWMAASALPTFQATSSVLYTKINGSGILSCECPDHSCQEVFWYRYLERTKTLQFLVYVNSAGREKHGEDLNVARFKGSVSSGQKIVYTLRITGLQEDEIGLYSCMFKTKNIMPVGYYIMPGVNPPTVQPPTVKTKRPVKICNCKPSNSPKGCEQLVLWPGIGALLLLAITLAGTLYYFSHVQKSTVRVSEVLPHSANSSVYLRSADIDLPRRIHCDEVEDHTLHVETNAVVFFSL